HACNHRCDSDGRARRCCVVARFASAALVLSLARRAMSRQWYNRGAMTLSTIKMTARQFLELGEDPPGVRLELVDGEIAVSPSPIPRHSFAIVALGRIVSTHVDQFDLGELLMDVDTIFGEHDVRRPDLLYFR